MGRLRSIARAYLATKTGGVTLENAIDTIDSLLIRISNLTKELEGGMLSAEQAAHELRKITDYPG